MSDDFGLGRAGREQDGKRIRTERNRTLTEEDRRRILLEGSDPQSAMLEVVTPGPLTDETGEPLPVVQVDDHRGLMYLDGKTEPRTPRSWEDPESEFRGAVHVNTLEDVMVTLRAKRAATPVYERLHALMRAILALPTPRAVQRRETDARSANDRDLSPQGEAAEAVGAEDAETVAAWLQMIDLLIERGEEVLDAHQGRPTRNYRMMTPEEKDALITGPRLRGLSPVMISAIYPELGVAKTIGNARRLSGQDSRGHVRPEPEVRAA